MFEMSMSNTLRHIDLSIDTPFFVGHFAIIYDFKIPRQIYFWPNGFKFMVMEIIGIESATFLASNKTDDVKAISKKSPASPLLLLIAHFQN